jgi:hypothetical protein
MFWHASLFRIDSLAPSTTHGPAEGFQAGSVGTWDTIGARTIASYL